MDDLALTVAISQGDHSAVRILFERHFDSLYRFLRQLTGHEQDAEDLAQETMIRVLKSAGRYDGRASLRTWALSIAYREFCRWRRRRIWLPLRLSMVSAGDLEREASDGALLLAVLSKLGEGHRAAFLLHYVEDLSIEEVGSVLGVPAGTIKSRLHVARSRLKSMLEQEQFYVTESGV